MLTSVSEPDWTHAESSTRMGYDESASGTSEFDVGYALAGVLESGTRYTEVVDDGLGVGYALDDDGAGRSSRTLRSTLTFKLMSIGPAIGPDGGDGVGVAGVL